MRIRKLAGMAIVPGCAVLLVAAASFGAATAKRRHVMIIGLDGVMPDAVRAAKAPNLKKLADAGTVAWDGFAGGVLGTPSRQKTASLQSWNSILTGVWNNKHKGQAGPPDHANFPCLFKRLKEANTNIYCSSVVNWSVINTQSMVPEADYKERGETDDKVVSLVTTHLMKEDPACIFVQLDQVDGAGHKSGYSTGAGAYLAAIEKADKQVGELVDAVHNRKNIANESWLFIVVTDHGGRGKSHGGDSPQERKALIIVSGEGAVKREVSPGPGIVVAAPTALKYLGIDIRPEWNLDGQPFGL